MIDEPLNMDPPFPTLPFHLLKPPLSVPTSWLRQKLYDYNNLNKSVSHHSVVDFLQGSIRNPNLARLRGDMFEPHAHELIQRGGKFWVQRLDSLNGTRIGKPHLVNIHVEGAARTIRRTDHVATLHPHQYGKPVKETCETTLDAVIHPNLTLQLTVSHSATLKSGDLFDVESQLNPLTRPATVTVSHSESASPPTPVPRARTPGPARPPIPIRFPPPHLPSVCSTTSVCRRTCSPT